MAKILPKNDKKYWTKDEIKSLIRLWDTKTVGEIASDLNIESKQVVYMATQIRKAGFKLARKRINGYLNTLIKEAFNEVVTNRR